MKRALLAAALLASLSACATAPTGTPAARPAVVTASALTDTRGLEAVIGQDATTLERLFGEPRLNVVEPVGRKLQFVGAPCILDVYLYPDGPGGREQAAYVDARRSDGAAVDRAACVAALRKR